MAQVPDFNGGGVQAVHVWFTVLIATTAICGFLYKIARSVKRTNDIMEKFMTEHEMLIVDYCERKGIPIDTLPTRLMSLLTRRPH